MVSFKLSVLFATLFLLPLSNPATCKAFPSFLTSGCLTKFVCSFNFAKTFLNPLKSLHQNCFIWTLGRNSISYGTIAVQFSSIQSLSRVQLFATPWTATCQAFLSIIDSQSLLKLTSMESVMPSNHLILCHPLLPPSIFPSIRIFSNESVLHIRWPKYWSFSFSISPSNEYSELISFRMDWLDLLADQGTLKNLLQHHSSSASILWCSAFFTVQISHAYMTTGKTIAWLDRPLLAK